MKVIDKYLEIIWNTELSLNSLSTNLYVPSMVPFKFCDNFENTNCDMKFQVSMHVSLS